MSGDGRLRFGLIGFGVGKLYAACLRALHDTYPDLPSNELVAIATASTESGQAAVAHFGFARATTDYRQLIGADDIDPLVIASPPRWHLPMLVEALASAKALYVDKPLARSLAEAQQILAIARQLGRDGQMIFEFRFWPAVQLAKRLLDEGRLGQIYAFGGKDFRSSYADPDVPLRWSLMDTNHLYYVENAHQASQGGWRQIPTVQRYPQAAIPGWDVPVGMMRFHLASLAAFVRATIGHQPYSPGLEQGARVQAIVEPARQAATQHRWVDVSSV